MPSRTKIDHPLKDDNEVQLMVEQFENCTWPYERWTHRAHLGVSLVYLQKYSFDEAVNRIRHHINLYNRACGDPNGYFETITLLYMRRIAKFLVDHPSIESRAETIERLANELDMRWPLNYYSPERLWSDEAKVNWVEPDLRGLDF